MGIDGLNVFGSLTVNGKKISFEDLDANKDRKISESEFKDLLAKEECDTLELSSIDVNADKVITEEEFADFEAKAQIQESLNGLQATIAKDFTGADAQYATRAMAELRDFAANFVSNYTGKGDMVADFKAALPDKYTEIKEYILNNTPEGVSKRLETAKQEAKSAVLDQIFEELVAEFSAKYPADTAKSMANKICKQLQTSANAFAKNYQNDKIDVGTYGVDARNFETDLKAHLESVLNGTDTAKMEGAVKDFKNVQAGMGGFLDDNDFATLKDAAKELLTTALNSGIILTLNGTKLSSTAQIDYALKKFTDADALNAAMDNLVSSLSTESLKDSVVNSVIVEQQAAEEKAFNSLEGDDIHVEPELLNYPQSYYNNYKITVKKQGRDGAKDNAVNYLETNFKQQFKEQIIADLKAKGVSADKLDQIFENVFTQSSWDAADICVYGKNGGWFRRSKSSFNCQDLVNKFVELFNANMANTINEMNKSNTDLDLHDVNWSLTVKDEYGFENTELLSALESGESVTTKRRGSDYYKKEAKKMIDRMKSTILAKSMAMCEANGIEFDAKVFGTMFDNAKKSSIAVNVSGSDFWFISESSINPQQLVKDFATNFEQSFTGWVEGQKAKTQTR